MTQSAKAISFLVEKARRQHNEACVQLARTARALRKAFETKRTLELFAADGIQARRARTGQLVDSHSLRIATGFSQSLDKAVQSQSQALEELRSAHRASNEALNATLRHVRIMERLQENLRRAQKQAADLAEQRETDEIAARMSGNKINSYQSARGL